jgi:peroxiredoxin
VAYAFPRIATPGSEPPGGSVEWSRIRGAKGCTAEALAFSEAIDALRARGATVYGLSTQDAAYQRDAAARLHLPFLLLSDDALGFATALGMPTFEARDADL